MIKENPRQRAREQIKTSDDFSSLVFICYEKNFFVFLIVPDRSELFQTHHYILNENAHILTKKKSCFILPLGK